MVERYFGDWKAPAEPLPHTALPAPPPALGAGVALFNQPNAKRSFVLGVRLTEPLAAEDIAATELFMDLFGRGSNARINDPPRRFQAYKTASDLEVRQGGTLFTMKGEVDSDQTVAFIQWLQRQMLDARGDRPFSDEEIAKEREARAIAYLSIPATTAFLTVSYEDSLARGGSEQLWFNQVAETRSITTRQVRMAAATLLDPSRTIWVVLGDAGKLERPLREHLGIPVKVFNIGKIE
jgi:zinc protease